MRCDRCSADATGTADVMVNPFLRRATEYVRDDASFLAIVSPAPLTTFLAKSPYKDQMFELPVRIIGEPGSGKTMLAKLAEFSMVEAILRDLSSSTNRELASALGDAGFLADGQPNVAAVRVPMESDYRDFWELPYNDAVKTKLALWLVQARTMLGLIRNLTANNRRGLGELRFVARDASEAQIEQIGGLDGEGIRGPRSRGAEGNLLDRCRAASTQDRGFTASSHLTLPALRGHQKGRDGMAGRDYLA